MKREWQVGFAVIFAAILSACTSSSTFMASKNGVGFFLGNNSDAAYKMFCESGDLRKILAETQLPSETKEELFLSNCGPERSKERVKQIFSSLTPAQRKDLRQAFRHNDYDINALQC